MDPVTTAIIGAIAAGTTSGLNEATKNVVVDLFGQLKNALKSKFGSDSDVTNALINLEKKPESEGRKTTLHEEVAAAEANKESELLVLAGQLLKQLAADPGGSTLIQQATGSLIAQAGPGASASVNVTRPRDDED